MHFYIRNAYADAGKCPTQPGKSEIWTKFFGGGAELPAFLRFMKGACYLLTTNNFSDDFEIIGATFSGEFHLLVYLLGVSWVTEITCSRFIEIIGLGWVHRNCMFEAWG